MLARGRIAAIILSFAVVLGGSHALANQDLFLDLEEQAQSARQLELLKPLDVTVKTRDDLKQEQQDSLEDDFPTEDAEDWNTVLVFLGYIAADDDIVAIYNDLMGEQILGYYDAETKQMVVVSTGTDEWNATDKTTFVHETVHALQDQHFDLVAIHGDLDNMTDDRYFALGSMIEGDATLAEMIYMVDNNLIDQIIKEQEGMDFSALDGVPFFLTESTFFPYETGAEFMLEIWKSGGWDAVNEVWGNPPTTSEQIIHPQKYIEGEGAIPFAINDPLPSFDDNWRLLEYNENGELGTRIFLQNGGASEGDATQAVKGWGGDGTYIITNDDETAMVWTAAWDSENDAIEYFDTLVDVETTRLGATSAEDGNTITLSADGWHGVIQRNGDVVTYFLAESQNALDTMQESQVDAEIQPDASPVGVATPVAPSNIVAFWLRET